MRRTVPFEVSILGPDSSSRSKDQVLIPHLGPNMRSLLIVQPDPDRTIQTRWTPRTVRSRYQYQVLICHQGLNIRSWYVIKVSISGLQYASLRSQYLVFITSSRSWSDEAYITGGGRFGHFDRGLISGLDTSSRLWSEEPWWPVDRGGRRGFGRGPVSRLDMSSRSWSDDPNWWTRRTLVGPSFTVSSKKIHYRLLQITSSKTKVTEVWQLCF
jgi:hypothetical protein